MDNNMFWWTVLQHKLFFGGLGQQYIYNIVFYIKSKCMDSFDKVNPDTTDRATFLKDWCLRFCQFRPPCSSSRWTCWWIYMVSPVTAGKTQVGTATTAAAPVFSQRSLLPTIRHWAISLTRFDTKLTLSRHTWLFSRQLFAFASSVVVFLSSADELGHKT